MIALINYPVLFLRVLFFELAMNIPCVVLGDNRDFLECAALKKQSMRTNSPLTWIAWPRV